MNWEDFGQGLPFLSNVEKLIVYQDKIIASTSDGLWQRDTSEIISVLEEHNNLPQEFELFHNYPNPFNPTTLISWQSSVGSYQTLKVYDLLGNEVATLVDEYKAAGSYEVEFSAKGGSDSGGNAYDLPSGIYFYKLQAGSFVQTQKMILLK